MSVECASIRGIGDEEALPLGFLKRLKGRKRTLNSFRDCEKYTVGYNVDFMSDCWTSCAVDYVLKMVRVSERCEPI